MQVVATNDGASSTLGKHDRCRQPRAGGVAGSSACVLFCRRRRCFSRPIRPGSIGRLDVVQHRIPWTRESQRRVSGITLAGKKQQLPGRWVPAYGEIVIDQICNRAESHAPIKARGRLRKQRATQRHAPGGVSRTASARRTAAGPGGAARRLAR